MKHWIYKKGEDPINLDNVDRITKSGISIYFERTIGNSISEVASVNIAVWEFANVDQRDTCYSDILNHIQPLMIK